MDIIGVDKEFIHKVTLVKRSIKKIELYEYIKIVFSEKLTDLDLDTDESEEDSSLDKDMLVEYISELDDKIYELKSEILANASISFEEAKQLFD